MLRLVDRNDCAALVYQEAAQVDTEEAWFHFEQSALAFRCTGNFVRAQQAIFESVRAILMSKSKPLKWKQEKIDTCVAGLIEIHTVWASLAPKELLDENPAEIELLLAVLLNLFVHAEYFILEKTSPVRKENALMFLGPHFVKQSLQDKKRARRILEITFRKPTIQEIQQSILSCTSHQVQLDHEFTPRLQQDSNETFVKEMKNDVRDKRSGARDCGFVIRSCSNCGQGKNENQLTICKCKHARYSDKDCQTAHWDRHRDVCKQYYVKSTPTI